MLNVIKLLIFLLVSFGRYETCVAQEINLLPKYGLREKSVAQKAEDQKFIATVDKLYKGDRKKGSEDLSARGWQFLREGKVPDAMRRFNQAWLIDSSNAEALWGMAAIEAGGGKPEDSLKLFSEAEKSLGKNIDFSVDYAKATGFAGAKMRNETLLKDAFRRYEHLYKLSPMHVLNLQNWAITLFYIGNYKEAWKKIELAKAAESGTKSSQLDNNFIMALQAKMPKP